MHPITRQWWRLAERRKATRSKRAAVRYEVLQRTRKLLTSVGTAAPPTDLTAIGRLLGVAAVRSVPLAMDGRLLREGTAYVIETNETNPATRQRFTVAHELGHLIVSGAGVFQHAALGGQLNGFCKGAAEEEILCNFAAAQLLIPDEWLLSYLEGKTPSFSVIAQVAKICATSIEAAARQIVEVGAWRCRLLWWREERGVFQANQAFPPYDPETLASMTLPDGGASLIASVLRHRKPRVGPQRISIQGIVDDYNVAAWSTGRGSVACLMFLGPVEDAGNPPRGLFDA